MMFITRALLGAAIIWGGASAVPGTPTQTPEPVALKSDQVFVTACADSLGDGPTEMGLFELRGQRNGRNYYAHVMDGMGTEIWFGQPARAPGQLVFDFDDNGPRTGPRWLIGHGPERTYYQAFADNDDPRPPSTGWAALFSSIITAPCLVFPPGPVPSKTMTIGALGISFDVPVTFRKNEPSLLGRSSVSFTDTATGNRWFLDRRNCGVAFANPPDLTLRRRLRQAKEISHLREVRKAPDGTSISGGATVPRQTYFLYRYGEGTHSICSFYSHGGQYTLQSSGEAADRAEREALLERICVGQKSGFFGIERSIDQHLRGMLTDLPASPHFEGLEATDGLLRLHDKEKKVWMKLLMWPLKGGSPYNDATDKNIRRRLKAQGCKSMRVRPGTLGKRKGWRARCEFSSPLDSREQVKVFTFVSRGENVWMVTFWAEDWDWATIESYADTVFKDVSLH